MKKLASFDPNHYHNTLYKKSYKLNNVKDKIEKVAFDVVRFKDDDDAAHLWEVQSADDGDYIVALHDTSEENVKKEASAQPWKVSVAEESFDVFFHDKFVGRFGYKEAGIPKNELYMVKSYLPQKLASDEKFANALISSAKKKNNIK